MHIVNLENKNMYTDLIIEKDITNKIVKRKYKEKDISIERVTIDSSNYCTIFFNDITDKNNYNLVSKVLIREIKAIIRASKLSSSKSCLVVGLGNKSSTPDALGPKTIESILTTRHLYLINSLESGYKITSKLSPGVMGDTGIETKDIVKGAIDKIKPDFVIVIDALKASNIKRVNHIIQISNIGIIPGEGVGNKRKELSLKTLGVPVITIGVPTIIETNYEDCFLMVTPKDIDFQIDKLSLLISESINKVLHKNYM